MQAGDYRAAEPVLGQAIANIELASGPDDPDLVFALNNLGALLIAKGEVARAETLFRRGLTIRQKNLGADDPRTANSLTNVAASLVLQGNAAAAEPLLDAAAKVFARASSINVPAPPSPAQQAVVGGGVLGNPGAVSVRLNQALLLLQRKRVEEARAIAEDVLLTQTQRFGPRRPETANALLVMGQTELAAGNAESAARRYEQAVEVIRGLLGPDHLSLAEALAGLGDAAVQLRDPARAKTAYDRAVAIRRHAFGDADPVAQTLTKKIGALR
jgi:tetratricopeptide (TPR) repeat protein